MKEIYIFSLLKMFFLKSLIFTQINLSHIGVQLEIRKDENGLSVLQNRLIPLS